MAMLERRPYALLVFPAGALVLAAPPVDMELPAVEVIELSAAEVMELMALPVIEPLVLAAPPAALVPFMLMLLLFEDTPADTSMPPTTKSDAGALDVVFLALDCAIAMVSVSVGLMARTIPIWQWSWTEQKKKAGSVELTVHSNTWPFL